MKNTDLDMYSKPMDDAAKRKIIKDESELAFIILNMSQTLVYLHIPRYRLNKRKQKIFITSNTNKFSLFINDLTSNKILKSNRNRMLKKNDK